MKMKWVFLFLWWPFSLFGLPFFESHHEGWFWYQDFPLEIKKPNQAVPTPISNPTETMLTFRKKVEDSLNLAILSPTPENLRHYAEQYFEVIRRGQRFTDGYKVMLLNYPQYDYSLQFPTNHLIQPIYENRQLQLAERKIVEFAKNHGFFFFFGSSCSYCHAFAPIVKQFVDKYSVSMIPISLDGGALPSFPKVFLDNGTAKAFRVYQVPALFAVNPKSKQVIPIANGLLSLSELEDNILKILETQHE